jgi:outer membrane protein TolC
MYSLSLSSAARRRRHRLPALAIACIFGLLAAAGVRAQDTLSLDHALRLAQDRSRQLVASDSAASAARDMAVAAGQLPDPVLRASITNLPIDGEDRWSLTRDFMTMRSIGLMQEFTRADKRRARASRLEREADAADANRTLALANLRRETAMAWFDRHYAERMRVVLTAMRDEARLAVDAADAAYRGARGMQADVFAARSAVAQIEDRLTDTERALVTALSRLARWIGDDAARPLAPPPDLSSVGIDAAAIERRAVLLPQIALAARQEDMARAESDVARSGKLTDWTVEFMYSQRGPAYSNMVSINVSVPLQWDRKNRQDREIAAAAAKAEQMRAEREEMTRERAADLRNWLALWQGNRERLRRYEVTLIPLAAERTRAALAAYRGGSGGGGGGMSGGGSLDGVLEARRMEIDTQMEKLRIEMETATLWTQLTFAFAQDKGQP